MRIWRISLCLLLTLLSVTSLKAADPKAEFDAQLGRVIGRLNREAQSDVDGVALVAELIQREFGTREDELRWAAGQSMTWGDMAALAYIQATTGRRFETMARENARQDFWSYAEGAGMSATKMARSLESFHKLVEKERNSRIFDRLRVSRRVQAMPDLGSGFGLFQEALDFRRIDSPRPTKIHTVASGKAKGDQ